MKNLLQFISSDKFLKRFVILILLLGVALRLVIYLQNRNLYIDEVNVARNLYERGFAGLTKPLGYLQFAPVGFLWMEKICTILFGFGEWSLRLYPLLCGIAALYVFYKLLIYLLPLHSVWYVLALVSFAPIFIDYATQMKQYMPDMMIALLLVWWVVRYTELSAPRFILVWTLAGSVAIWWSMPSVFVLAGVGAYYCFEMIRAKHCGKLKVLLPVFAVWLIQFSLCYFYTLKPQIGSSYLQNFHQEYFLFLLPHNAAEWQHNGERLMAILGSVGGYTAISIGLNLLCLVIGAVYLFRKQTSLFLLLFVPVVCLLVAGALKQYSLIERLLLFMMPLLLTITAFGFAQIFKLRFVAVKLVLILAAFIGIGGYNLLPDFWYKYSLQEVTEGLDYLNAQNAKGDQVYIHNETADTYYYYTEMHPQKEKYASLKGAHIMQWDDDYGKAVAPVSDTCYLVFTGGGREEAEKRENQITHLHLAKEYAPQNHAKQVVCRVLTYIYLPQRH